MVEERPRRRGRKKGRVRPKKAPAKRTRAKAKKPLVPEEEQLPGLLEGEIPEQPPVAEEAAVEEEQPAVAEEAAVEEEQPAVAEEAAVEEERPAVAEEAAIIAEAVKEAVRAPQPKRAKEPAQPSTLPSTLMTIPEFRQRVIRSLVRRLR